MEYEGSIETTSRKYAALNAYSGIIRIFGWILLILGVLAFIGGLLSSSVRLGDVDLGSIFLGLPSGIGIVVAGLGTVAMGQLICVWADTEENTRRIVELLEKNSK